MSQSIHIRTARASDRAVLTRLHRRASYIWPEDREQLDANPDVFGVSPASLDAGAVRVAIDAEGRAVGFATVAHAGSPVCELDDLFVDPDVMRRGIGGRLVRDAAARAARAGSRQMTVVAGERTLRFYARAGFSVAGTATTQFGPALHLTRPLAPEPQRDGS